MSRHPRHVAVLAALLAALWSCMATAVGPAGYALQFHVVGTPEFMGPPRVQSRGFVPPVASQIHLPAQAQCLADKGGAGEYEIHLDASGRVTQVHSHHDPVDGDACERTHLFPYLRQWRFMPATFEGRPTPAILWIGL